MIELDIIAYLNNDDTLSTLLGSTVSDSKIYPSQMPHGATAPFIIYTTSSNGGLQENMNDITMSFNCVDDSYLVAKQIRDRISALLDVQDQAQWLISSASYKIFWSKLVGGTTFKEPELDNFHDVAVVDFQYIELTGRFIDVINKSITFPMFGSFVDEFTIFNGYRFPAAVTITAVEFHSNEAPTGADATLDILLDSVEQTRIATLTDGTRDERTNITDLAVTSAQDVGAIIKSIGSTNPGAGGTIVFHYK